MIGADILLLVNTAENDLDMKPVDPFLLHRLNRLQGNAVCVQTTSQTVQGALRLIHSDSIIVYVAATPRYIQINDIVWITKHTSPTL